MASIHPRGPKKDGTYSYRLMWRDPEYGPRHETFQDKHEAELWKRLLDANGQSLTIAHQLYEEAKQDGPTMAVLFEEHFEQLTDVGAYQLKRYRSAVEQHFSGLLARKVAGITRRDIAAWINEMKAKPGRYGQPLSAKSIANQHGLLSAAMNTALVNGYRADNPCKGIKLPKSTHTEEPIRFITRDEWDAILGNLDPHFLPFFQFLVGSGLRFGEATALKAADFNLDAAAPSVRVTKAWKQDDNGGYFIGPPKTKKSRRTVSLAPSTIQAIRARVEAAGEGYVFTLKQGGVMRSGATYNRAWEPALLKCGYVKHTEVAQGNMPRMHDIRHTHASWLIAAGMEIFQLSRRLGHESVTTTMDRYSHLLPDAAFSAIQIAEKALEG